MLDGNSKRQPLTGSLDIQNLVVVNLAAQFLHCKLRARPILEAGERKAGLPARTHRLTYQIARADHSSECLRRYS